MLPPRRIFRPAASPLAWRILAGVGAAAAALSLVLAVPSDLFGSAPEEPPWSVPSRDVRVIDGDTLSLGERTVRLRGISAPARGRNCVDGEGRPRDCGGAAAAVLAALVAERPVECRMHGRDRQGRTLGDCRAGGVELNASLVAAGWAEAAGGDRRLGPLQEAARRDGRGLWSGRVE